MQFSIIIPAKNEVKNLSKTLPQFDPVRKEFAIEVIVADGQSTDGSIELEKKLAQKVEVKSKVDRETIGEGRNRGAKVAEGDILVFLDAGVIVPDTLNFFQTIWEAFADPRVVAATTNVNIYPEEANWQDKTVQSTVNFLIRHKIKMGTGSAKGECHIIRRTAFEHAGGYNEVLAAGEDHELMQRLTKHGKILFFNDLQVYDDPRRYRKLGYPRVIFQWVRNGVYVNLFGRAYDKEWKRID